MRYLVLCTQQEGTINLELHAGPSPDVVKLSFMSVAQRVGGLMFHGLARGQFLTFSCCHYVSCQQQVICRRSHMGHQVSKAALESKIMREGTRLGRES